MSDVFGQTHAEMQSQAPPQSGDVFDQIHAQTQSGQKAAPETGIWAGVKRNTVGMVAGLYHAFSEPATEQEKRDLLAKIREQNAEGDNIPEDLATNPSRATLAYHRLIDAPADVLAQKGKNAQAAARDLLSKRTNLESRRSISIRSNGPTS